MIPTCGVTLTILVTSLVAGCRSSNTAPELRDAGAPPSAPPPQSAAAAPVSVASAAAAAAEAGRGCVPTGAPPRSYCDGDPIELTGKLVMTDAHVSDGIGAHGKVAHHIWVLELDAPIRLYSSEPPVDSKRVQLNAQVATEKRWVPGLVGKRVVARGALHPAGRPHEIESIVMWGGQAPPTVTLLDAGAR